MCRVQLTSIWSLTAEAIELALFLLCSEALRERDARLLLDPADMQVNSGEHATISTKGLKYYTRQI